MEYFGFSLLLFAALMLTTLSALGQHKYYVRTVRRLAREHDTPGLVLVSGQAKGRWRGAVVILVLRKEGEVIEVARVMEGSSVLSRFKDRPDWVGLPAAGPLPGCSERAAAAVAKARQRVPGKPVPPTAPPAGPLGRRFRPNRSPRAGSTVI
jgi:glucitol operon activator protein